MLQTACPALQAEQYNQSASMPYIASSVFYFRWVTLWQICGWCHGKFLGGMLGDLWVALSLTFEWHRGRFWAALCLDFACVGF